MITGEQKLFYTLVLPALACILPSSHVLEITLYILI